MASRDEIDEIKEQLQKLVFQEKKRIFSFWWCWNSAMLQARKRPEFRTCILQFVDALPRLKNVADIYPHLKQYLFDSPSLPFLLKPGRYLGGFPPMRYFMGLSARTAVHAMAHHFIVQEKPRDIRRVIQNFQCLGAGYSLDVLGEQVISEAEAEDYKQRYLRLIDFLCLGGYPIDLSLKLSSLYSQFGPLREESSFLAIRAQLGEIAEALRGYGGRIIVDMEPYYFRNLTWEIFKRVVQEEEFQKHGEWGIAHQVYLLDSEDFLEKIIRFARELKTSLTVRIVKGAYWDYEYTIAEQKNWPLPVYTSREETDASFERNVDLALANYPAIKTAIGSHNLSSIAYAMARQQQLGLPKDALEVQVLYGLGWPLVRPALKLGYPTSVYVGIGDMLGGMGFLARRLLENTSQASSAFFVKSRKEKE